MARRTVEDITIEKLAHGGDGLAYLPDGRVCFVQGGLPGDVADLQVYKEKKNWARARVERIKKASEHRVTSQCDAFKRGCGGCDFWDATYEGELQWKTEAAYEAMKRISQLELPEAKVEKAPSIRDYRSRVTFHQRKDGDEVRRGFFAEGSHDVVEVDRCPVAEKAIDEACEEFGGPLSMLGNADIAMETAGDGTVVLLVALRPKERIRHDVLNELSLRLEQGVVVRGLEIVDDRGKYFILGDTTVDAGEALASPPLESMRIKPGHFRQANRAMNKKLVDHVVDVVSKGQESPAILEVFCGSGNFSFPLARVARSLVGFEGSEPAVETARQMASMAEGMDHLRFDVADLYEAEVVANVLEEPFDVVLLDPPREGAAEVARQLAEHDKGSQIIYVSCDPACLARDLKTLAQGGWEVDELTFYDLFPRTAHLEVVAVLSRV